MGDKFKNVNMIPKRGHRFSEKIMLHDKLAGSLTRPA